MTVRLRHISAINPPTPEFDRLAGDAEIPFVPLEAVWPGDRLDVSRRRRKDDVATGYTRFRNRDILVPKITPTFQADRTVIAQRLEGGVAAGTTELHIVRVGPVTDARYVRYLLSSKPFLDEGEASMIGVAGQKRVPDECLRHLVVPVVDVGQQRAIADYLDAETARIDALIEKKRRMVELLEERRRRHISLLLWSDAYRRIRLKNVVGRPTSGNRDHSSFSLTDEGVPCLRGLNVRQGWIDRANLLFIAHGEHLRHAASELHAGDVVVVRSGLAGSAAVIPEDLDRCNCVDLVIIRHDDCLDSKYLAYVLNSDEAQEQIRRRTSGALLMHFNADQCGELHIPYPARTEQRCLVTELDRAGGRLVCLGNVLEQQVGKLAERRQALITAAVTGELPIPRGAA